MSQPDDLSDDFMLRRSVTFLNHGSFGACPRPVFEAYQRWQRELEAEPVEFLGRRVPGLLAEARAGLAAYVGAPVDDLVFVPNATNGTNIVARSLDLRPGDEVLGSDHEYGACEKAWRFVCERTGARYVKQPIPLPLSDPAQVVEALWRGVTERTRLIFISHITSPTALIFPVAEVCRRARAAGILTMVDGAHAPGQLDLALEPLGADFYTANCHKWLCSPKGAGFLYARPAVQALLRPLIVSWGWEQDAVDEVCFQECFRWTGTDDPAAYLAVADAISYQESRDWRAVRLRCHQLASETRARIEAISGLDPICPNSLDWFGQMVAARLPAGVDAAALSRRLWEEARIEVPGTHHDGVPLLRVSIQAYNSRQDADRLVGALESVVRSG